MRRQRVTEPVRHERALLCRIATRLAINALRSETARKETYPGLWLPEPVTAEPELDEDMVLAEAVSEATLIVLETLSPTERAAFLLVEDSHYRLLKSAISWTQRGLGAPTRTPCSLSVT